MNEFRQDKVAVKISRMSQIFLDAPLARTIANFGRKSCFLVSYSPNPSCLPNLKLLASVAAIYVIDSSSGHNVCKLMQTINNIKQ